MISELNCCYWNINRVGNKLECESVSSMLQEFDVIWISELKTYFDFNLAGYKSYRSTGARYDNHGGICMLIKNFLTGYIKDTSFERDDGISVSFTFQPNVIFWGFYIPPSDSRYYDDVHFALLMSRIKSDNRDVVVLGDLNAKIKDYSILLKESDVYSYKKQPENVQNAHGTILQDICIKNNLLIINNLKSEYKRYVGALTFRRRNKWISELDLCVVTRSVVPYISDFRINHDISLPSNHAPINIIFKVNIPLLIQSQLICSRAMKIGSYEVPEKSSHRKPLRYHKIDISKFKDEIAEMCPEMEIIADNVDKCVGIITDNMYDAASRSIRPEIGWNTNIDRWTRLLRHGDSKTIWKAIDWKGDIAQKVASKEPDTETFKLHFESLLNPDNQPSPMSVDTLDCPFIPVLDRPFNMGEMVDAQRKLKADKATDLQGNSPGVYKHLTMNWLVFVLNLFNVIFFQAKIPMMWTMSKLIVLFKKGYRQLCGNYRGISINDNLYKLFDQLLYQRMSIWFRPEPEQAGSQKGRDCTEQILTVRLLCDYVKKKKKKLFLLFIDFEKAYDKIERHKLIEELKILGCGGTFITIIAAIYSTIIFLFKTVSIATSVGVKQGAATSCLLFVLYVDRLIKKVKEASGVDGFLGKLHILMLMDDTILLATNRRELEKKMNVVNMYCIDYGMSINNKKTKFMVINNEPEDKVEMICGNTKVEYCSSYVYLGCTITDDGACRSCIEAQAKAKQKQVLKYLVFLNKNPNLPFKLKKKVAEACVISSLLYGCETWFISSFGKIETMYMKMVKCMLDVRHSTCNDLCLLEAGMPLIRELVAARRARYIRKKFLNLPIDTPLYMAYVLGKDASTKSARIISQILEHNDPDGESIQNLIRQQQSIKRSTYLEMNPELIESKIYSADDLPEYLRIAYTRFRLSSHKLKIETGRWKGTPRENRRCKCDENSVQDETHALLFCPLTLDIRRTFGICQANLASFFKENDGTVCAKVIYKVLKVLE